MDRYDKLILEIIHDHQKEHGNSARVGLRQLEQTFWDNVKLDEHLSSTQGRLGERITKLYIANMIENREGYKLTRLGKTQLISVSA